MLELSEVIAQLRGELKTAMQEGTDESLRFELGPVEVEVSVGVERDKAGTAKIRFWVLELGGDAKSTNSSTHRIKLTLEPKLAASGKRPWVSGQDTGSER